MDNPAFMVNADYYKKLGKQNYAKAHLKQYYKPLFFEKMRDWRDEAEWRFVVFTNDERDIFINYKESLIGIMFGVDATDEDVETIIKLTSPQALDFNGIKWQNGSAWYDYGNLRYNPSLKNSPWGTPSFKGITMY